MVSLRYSPTAITDLKSIHEFIPIFYIASNYYEYSSRNFESY